MLRAKRNQSREAGRATYLGRRLLGNGFVLLVVSFVVKTLFLPQLSRKRLAVQTASGGEAEWTVGPTAPHPVARPSPEEKLVIPTAQHERADVGPVFIAGAFALLMISLTIITLGVLWLFPLPDTDRTLHAPLPVYPEPRLQASPRQEMQRFMAQEIREATSYGWIDKSQGIVRIPIGLAMQKIAQRGIPDWPGPRDDAAKAEGRSSSVAGNGQP